MECKDEPPIVDELYGGYMIVDQDLVCEGIAATLALIPGSGAFDFWWEIVTGSEGC